MSAEFSTAKPMVSVTLEPDYRIRIEETCGIAHERQVLEVAMTGPSQPASDSPSSPSLPPLRSSPRPSQPPLRSFLAKGRSGTDAEDFVLTDQATGRKFPVQRSLADPAVGFLLIGIQPGETLELEPADATELPDDSEPVTLTNDPKGNYILANGRVALCLNGDIWRDMVPPSPIDPNMGRAFAWAGGRRTTDDTFSQGPVRGVRRLPGGKWRGNTTFDTRASIRQWQMEVLEHGPLRIELRFRANPSRDSHAADVALAKRSQAPKYEATFTLDAGADFVRISERWDGNTPGEQIVWDFSGADLPEDILRLDSTGGCAVEPLHYFYDHRICRLFAWTQQSQLSDLSDGFALTFAGGDAVGFVTLEGGSWKGNRLNHMEAWSRRWIGDSPASRRSVPDAAKRDAFPSPERIPARGEKRTVPHLNVEGWIGETGERAWALVAAETADLMPGANLEPASPDDRGCSVALRHFEHSPDRERDRRESSRLRRIHTQHGLLPLSKLANSVLRWPTPLVDASPSEFTYPNPIVEEHLKHRDKDAPEGETTEEREQRRKAQMVESLAARVYGFWEGGASGATNPVVSRDIAPRMLQYEYLAATGHLSPDEDDTIRSHFAFLTQLFGSDNYYPGLSTMLPADHPDSVEPTLEGMANQNFYTDVVNVCGMAAQVFPNHPAADIWRTRFGEHWARQLAYHMYPSSGVWEESHTYFQHVLFTVLPTLLRRRADGVDDGFADPAFRTLVRGAIRQVTPRDSRFGDSRYLAPFGDHSAGHASYGHLYKPLAEAIAPHDPELAGQLAWMYREMGGRETLAVAVTAPPLTSEYVEGLGYFLRGIDDEGLECLLALRSGSAWGHHHHDEGSIQFWAKGKSLIVDAGFGEWAAGKRKFSDTGHSRWTLADFPAMNYGFRFNRGWITAQDAAEPFPYAVAHAPTYLQAPSPGTVTSLPGHAAAHRRAIVRIGPCAFLVVDVAETHLAQTIRFHVPESSEIENVDGGVRLGCGENRVLTLTPVLAGQAALAIAATDRLDDGKSTIEIAAAVASAAGTSRAVYLIAADSESGARMPRVARGETGETTVSGHGFDVRLEWAERCVLKVTNLNLNSGGPLERSIDLSAPARCVF